jgi:CHAT domain-containing protein/tetratricopeptide (TPR) repeat protein
MPSQRVGLFCLLLALVLAPEVSAQGPAQQAKGKPPPRTLPQVAQELSALGAKFRELMAAGRSDEADAVSARMEQCQREALARIGAELTTLESLRGTFRGYLASTLAFRADAAEERDDLDAALAARREIVEIKAALLGDQNWEVADARRDLADVERNRRRTPEERRQVIEAERLRKRAQQLCGAGKWPEALPLAEKSVAIRERLLGKDSPGYAAGLSKLADVCAGLGQTERALALYRQVVEIRRHCLGENHPVYAQGLHNLAAALFNGGDDSRALALYSEALGIKERVLGKTNLMTIDTRNNLGSLYLTHGDYEKAEPLLKESLEITKAIYGASSLECATLLVNLAALELARGNDVRAEGLYREVLAIRKKALGEKNPAYAAVLNDLGALNFTRGDYAKAEPLFVEARDVFRSALGENHPSFARSLHNLAGLYQARGELARAEPLYEQALTIRKKTLGPAHTLCAQTLEELAILHAAQGRYGEAIDNEDEARRAFRRHIQHVLPSLSEHEQLVFLAEVDRASLWTAFSLGLERREDPSAARKSADWVLNGKGLAQQTLAERALLARQSRDASIVETVRQLEAVRSRLAQAALSSSQPPLDGKAGGATLVESLSRQEQELAARVSESRGVRHRDDPWVSASLVQQVLPRESVLVEIARFRVFDFHHGDEMNWWQPPRYAAWVLPPEGMGDIRLVDLGPAEEIEKAISLYRTAMRSSALEINRKGEPAAEAEIRIPLVALAQRVLRPLEPVLARFSNWQISPDAALWLVPWGALPLEDGFYALEKHTINYLVSGRDLLSSSSGVEGKGRAGLVVADPDFDLTAGPSPAAGGGAALDRGGGGARASASPISTSWPRLPGTSEEAEAILPSVARFLGGKPEVLTGALAAEATVKRAQRPRVLLLATHGFFLPDQRYEAPANRPGAGVGGARSRAMENPLLRCGLVLSGANQRLLNATPGGDDGILTGLEVVGIDLRGTELVVLSACETGLGDLHQGEGIAGLRQAFQLAGANAVIASLWQIPDEETADLMIRYWDELAAGRSFCDALDFAQRAVIKVRRKAGRAAHPLFWAAFTLTGPVRTKAGAAPAAR